MRTIFTFLVTFLLSATLALGQFKPDPFGGDAGARDDADPAGLEVIAGLAQAVPGQPLPLALRVTLKPGWHTYWINGGQSGFPMQVTWSLPPGVVEPGDFRWPTPEKFDAAGGDVVLISYGYHHDFVVLTELMVPQGLTGDTLTIQVSANQLVCETSCIPVTTNASLTLPLAAADSAPIAANPAVFAAARAALPAAPGDWGLQAELTGGTIALRVTPPAGASLPADITFIPAEARVLSDAAPQPWRDGVLTLTRSEKAKALPTHLRGVLRGPDAWPDGGHVGLAVEVPIAGVEAAAAATGGDLTQVAPPTSTVLGLAVTSVWVAMLGGFVGGLILNIMPCVLPVLSIKILSFIEQSKEESHHPMTHGLAYSAGVIVSFWALGAVAVLIGGWGVQFQNPTFLLIMILLFFIFGLSLFGVFEVGGALVGLGANAGGGLGGSFATGLLAVLVATPCTAPLMGPAIGWAVTQPALVVAAVFTALGLGMASPYLVLAAFPKLLDRIPRPGQWMVRLKQFFGFLLMGTAVFFIYVMGSLTNLTTVIVLLAALVLVGIGCWVLGEWGEAIDRPGVRWTARGVFLGLLVLAFVGVKHLTLDESHITWQPWSPAAVAEARAADRIVFIDFTADWCITCKFNEARAFTPEVAAHFDRHDVLPLMADWTARDDIIAQALAGYGRRGVPLYVVYGPGAGPIVIDGVLSAADVIAAVERAAAGEAVAATVPGG